MAVAVATGAPRPPSARFAPRACPAREKSRFWRAVCGAGCKKALQAAGVSAPSRAGVGKRLQLAAGPGEVLQQLPQLRGRLALG